jgi:hypothetical protein
LLDARDCKFGNESIKAIFDNYLMRDLTATGRIKAVFDELEKNKLQREKLQVPWLDELFKETKEMTKKNP